MKLTRKEGYALLKARSEQDKGAVQREILNLLGAAGTMSFRELKRYSIYWQSQVAFALARQMKAGNIVRVDEGRYARIYAGADLES